MSGKRAYSGIDRILGAALKRIRLDTQLSQHVLADKLGIPLQQLQQHEQGVRRVSAARLYDIAKLIGIPVSEFFREGAAAPEDAHDVEALDALFDDIGDDRVQRRVIDLVKSIGAPTRL